MSSLNSPVATPVEAKEFSCSFCHREFRRLEHLQRHTRRHTHEKPFSCSCGDAFSRRDLLRRHERMAHGLFNNVSHRSLNGATSTGPRSYSTENAHILPYSDPSRHMGQNLRSTRHFPTSPTGEWPQRRNQQGSAHETTPLHGRFAELDKLLGADDGGPLRESAGDVYNVPIGGAHNTGPFTRSLPEVNTPVSEIGSREATEAPHQQPTILPSPPVALGAQIVPHVSHPIVTECQRERLLQSLDGKLPQGVVLPSSDALTRFLAGFFTGFYPHMPFTHAPTFKLELCSPQLSLAIFALGAANRYELSSATTLFHLSKATLTDYQREREYAAIRRLTSSERRNSLPERDYLDELRCLLCLGWFSTWQKGDQLRAESLMLRGSLAQTLRLSGLEEVPQFQMSWDTWAQHESARRTKLLAFCFLNLQSVAFDLPPIIWSHEFKLLLPCTCPEWTAPDSTTWNLLRDNMPCRQGNFQDALFGLLDTDQGTTNQCIPTPVANYVLLHGLIQAITSSHILPTTLGRKPFSDDVILFKNALRRWTIFWQRTPESNLEPLDPNGPLPFTSSALLSLAYIRNCSCVTYLHPRDLQSWNPAGIADNMQICSTSNNDWNELPAAQHASHILGILTKLGIQYVKHNQALVWNIEAALCGFECAVFLEKWLRGLQHSIGGRSLSEPEQILLKWIQDIISEALLSMDYNGDTSNQSQIKVLADRVVEVWSDVMRGNSPWEFITMLGEALVEYKRASHVI